MTAVSEVMLQVEKIAAQYAISDRSLVLSENYDLMRAETVYRLVRKVATWQPDAEFQYPDGWWQHFKAQHRNGRWLGWIARRFPPRLHIIKAAAILPQYPLPDKGQYLHVPYFKDPEWFVRPGPDWGER